MSLDIASLVGDSFRITPDGSADALKLTMSGEVEDRDPGQMLNPYWTSVDQQIRAGKLKQVELDLRPLTFMNSSGILTLVRWITKAKTHPAEAAYTIVIRFDTSRTWQKTNVPALAKLAPQVVRAEGG